MAECYSCGISEDKTTLYEGVHKSFGVVKVCRKCYFKEKLPLVEKKKIEIPEKEVRLTVRERLAKMAGLNSEGKKDREPKKHVFTPEDIGLKTVVEENAKKSVEEGPAKVEDLIDNFNWVIMRKRRQMKLSFEELAREVKDQAVIIEALEKGKLPRNYVELVKKLESYFGVRLFKDKKPMTPDQVINESRFSSGLTISDIKRETKKVREDEQILINNQDSVNIEELDLDKIKEISGEPEKKEDKNRDDKNLDELTDDEINDLIFGRKK